MVERDDDGGLVVLERGAAGEYLIAGWRNQWSDGGNVSSGLPAYLIEQRGARKVGRLGREVERMCYPFQIAGTHDAFRPAAAFEEGLPSAAMHWDNEFYDAGDGLLVFLGEEPWFELELYGRAIFQAARRLGLKQLVAVEGYNGPAPPDLERRVGGVFSQPEMGATLERYGIQFSNYGSGTRQGPTIGMALVTLAHYGHPEVSALRLGAMAPMYPFSTSGNRQVGIVTDYRAFYDIMRRLRAMFGLDLDLSDLERRGNAESARLQETLERIGGSNPKAREIIERVRADYSYTPFEEPVELPPQLDRALEDILRESGEGE